MKILRTNYLHLLNDCKTTKEMGRLRTMNEQNEKNSSVPISKSIMFSLTPIAELVYLNSFLKESELNQNRMESFCPKSERNVRISLM